MDAAPRRRGCQFISRGVDALQCSFFHLLHTLASCRPTVGVKFPHHAWRNSALVNRTGNPQPARRRVPIIPETGMSTRHAVAS